MPARSFPHRHRLAEWLLRFRKIVEGASHARGKRENRHPRDDKVQIVLSRHHTSVCPAPATLIPLFSGAKRSRSCAQFSKWRFMVSITVDKDSAAVPCMKFGRKYRRSMNTTISLAVRTNSCAHICDQAICGHVTCSRVAFMGSGIGSSLPLGRSFLAHSANREGLPVI